MTNPIPCGPSMLKSIVSPGVAWTKSEKGGATAMSDEAVTVYVKVTGARPPCTVPPHTLLVSHTYTCTNTIDVDEDQGDKRSR